MVITSRFAGTCVKCKAALPAGVKINWVRGTGSWHLTAQACAEATAAVAAQPVAVVPTVNVAPLVAFLSDAKARGLRYPKVRFAAPGGGELKLSLAGEASRNAGAVNVVLNGEWLGCVRPDGELRGRLSSRADVLTALDALQRNPAAGAQAYARLTSTCSFCGKMLTDLGSIEVGYGPVCAASYGLPHQPRGSQVVALGFPSGALDDTYTDGEFHGDSVDRAELALGVQ